MDYLWTYIVRFLTRYGFFTAWLSVVGWVYFIYLVIRWVIPIWIRIGIGISKRKIAVFSSSQTESLKKLLVDSKIFNEKNINSIPLDSIKSAEWCSIFLIHRKDCSENIKEILDEAKDNTAIIVYAPHKEWKVEWKIDRIDIVDIINSHRNSVIVNMRWRLLNDIITSMITTSYKLKNRFLFF